MKRRERKEVEKQEEGPESKKLGPVTLRFMQTMESTLRVGVLMIRKAQAGSK